MNIESTFPKFLFHFEYSLLKDRQLAIMDRAERDSIWEVVRDRDSIAIWMNPRRAISVDSERVDWADSIS